MNKPLQAVLIVACLFLAGFNVALLMRNSRNQERIGRLSEENGTLRDKDPLMIEEIFSLFEHRLEGRSVAPLLARVRQDHGDFALPKRDRFRTRTLILVPDSGALDRVRRETTQWVRWAQACLGEGAQPSILIAGTSHEAQELTARLRDLSSDVAVDQGRDWMDSFTITSDPIFLVLGAEDRVIHALVSKTDDLRRSKRFYEKLDPAACSRGAL